MKQELYICKKVRYGTKGFAEEDILKIRDKSKRDKIPVKAYKCPHCNAWHLTSKGVAFDEK